MQHHTHRYITDPMLRHAFAVELWRYKATRKHATREADAMLRFGMESGIWAVQKVMWTYAKVN